MSSAIATLYVLRRQPRSVPGLPHVGFVVAKKVEKRAAKRNLAKRRVREAYRQARLKEASVKQWYAMVWVIHNQALTASWDEVQAAVSYCLGKASARFCLTDRNNSKKAEEHIQRLEK